MNWLYIEAGNFSGGGDGFNMHICILGVLV